MDMDIAPLCWILLIFSVLSLRTDWVCICHHQSPVLSLGLDVMDVGVVFVNVGIVEVGVWPIATIVWNVDVNVLPLLTLIMDMDIAPLCWILLIFSIVLVNILSFLCVLIGFVFAIINPLRWDKSSDQYNDRGKKYPTIHDRRSLTNFHDKHKKNKIEKIILLLRFL
uniref:Secreted protein n=1 Tax=Lutzomyia longipalpis TaxID=7200 RepID=A0A7G3B897_LUTLO